MKHPLFLCLITFWFHVVFPIGFSGNTLVKTPSGYTSINQLRVDDKVIAYDFVSNIQVIGSVKHKYVGICYGETTLKYTVDQWAMSPYQLVYSLQNKAWITAHQFAIDYQTINSNSQKITSDAYKLGFYYDLTVEPYHNFYVSKNDILVHNFFVSIPILTWTIGEGITFFEGASLISAGILAVKGLLSLNKALKKSRQKASPLSSSSGDNFSSGPPNNNDDEEEKRYKRDGGDKTTNKVAKEQAEKHGWKETKDHPIKKANSMKEKVYKKGKRYITRDRTGHGGGYWKEFKRNGDRLATLDFDFNPIRR